MSDWFENEIGDAIADGLFWLGPWWVSALVVLLSVSVACWYDWSTAF